MVQPGTLAYYNQTSKTLKPTKAAHNFTVAKKSCAFLWGDEVYVISVKGADATLSAKGHHSRIPIADLRKNPLLSIYQIDCGQGDAALIQFPDGRWMVIDGGPPRSWSNSGKIAADFLYWKMFVDQSWKNEFGFRKQPFRLDDVVCTHPDVDHFGGLMDLVERGVQKSTLEFGTVYHNGMARVSGASMNYENGVGHGQLGPVNGDRLPDAFLTALIDDFDDVRSYSKPSRGRSWKLTSQHGKWLNAMARLEGRGVRRAGNHMTYLPGYEPNGRDLGVRVLGPVVESWQGKPALCYLDAPNSRSMAGPSLTRNGHSVVRRIDYGKTRVLLTGDLNFRAHALLLKNTKGGEFACDVAKACHHGSEDVSSTFLEEMRLLATMFSSGDNESYAHRRAKVLGMAGLFGKDCRKGKNSYLGLTEDRHVAPLIYSTELSRSIQLFSTYAAYDNQGKRIKKPQFQALHSSGSGGGVRADMREWLLANNMTYGLINVRTDGQKVVMAALKESDSAFQVEELLL